MKYKCSKCGGDVRMVYLVSDPPITKYKCSVCGATKYVKDKQEPITINMEVKEE